MGADLAIELEEHVNGNGRHGALVDATLSHVEPDEARDDVEAVDEAAGLGAVIESMLLAAGAPVPLARLVDALDGPDRREVAAALRALGASYEREGRGLRLVYVAGGYQLRSAPEHGPWVRRLLGGRPPRLSRPLLETLAIVAYRQPCTRPEIEAIRGVDADAVLSTPGRAPADPDPRPEGRAGPSDPLRHHQGLPRGVRPPRPAGAPAARRAGRRCRGAGRACRGGGGGAGGVARTTSPRPPTIHLRTPDATD